MVEIKNHTEEETELGPREINPENVMYWSKHYKEIIGNFKKKSLRFLDLDCIKYVGDDLEFRSKYTFLVLPLNKEDSVLFEGRRFTKKPHSTDYNSSVYKIYKNPTGKFECSCQGHHKREKDNKGNKDGCQCSHVLALFLAFKCGYFRR